MVMSAIKKLRKAYTLTKEFGVSDGLSAWVGCYIRSKNSGVIKLKSKTAASYIHVRLKDSDLTVFEMTFLSQEYKDPSDAHRIGLEKYYAEVVGSGKSPVIIDCGANIGMSAIWFSKKYPDAKVIAIEPEPENFRIMQKNIQNFKNIIPVHAGISNQNGRLRVHNAGDGAWGFQVLPDTQGQIDLITINDALAMVPNHQTIIVKVDIEGYEDALFSSNTDWILETAMIVVESHDWMFPWRQTAKAINNAIFKTGDWDQLQHGENLFFYSHDFLKNQ